MNLTADGPASVPLRKVSVRSSGAPKIAAAAVAVARSGEDARKWVAGGAKVSGSGGLVTIDQF